MPIDLVIDERDGTKPPSELGHTGNGDASRSLDSASHTDGASTPDVVSIFAKNYLVIKLLLTQNFGPWEIRTTTVLQI